MRLAISILVVLVPLLLQEFGELAPWMAERLLRWGTGWLPPEHRERYEQDWLGELDAIPGKITKLVFVFRLLVRVPATERALTDRDALRVLAAKRVLALLVTGLLAVVQSLIRLGDQLSRRTDDRTDDRAWLQRLEPESAAAQEEAFWQDLKKYSANVEGIELTFDEFDELGEVVQDLAKYRANTDGLEFSFDELREAAKGG
jgi:hypothetical protein